MGVVFTVHRIFGEMILPLLIVIAAVWLTVTWKTDGPRHPVARIFPVLVDIQVGLGLIIWIYGVANNIPGYLEFPFILHPILGLLAAGLGHMAVSPRNPLRNLGRWSPVAALGLLLLVVVGNVFLVTTT